MKLLFRTFLIVIFSTSFLVAQCPISGYVLLKNQAQIDSFPILYPDCETFQGVIQIQPDSPETDDIVNLDALSGLKTLDELYVFNCNFLTEVNINDSIQIGYLLIYDCPHVEKIQVINNLPNDGGLHLKGLTSLDSTIVYDVDSLLLLGLYEMEMSSLNFLGNLQNVTTRITLKNNTRLSDISLFSDFTTNYFSICENPKLSMCSIDAVCRAIGIDVEKVNILNNGVGCTDEFDVFLGCYPNTGECAITELFLRNQTDLDQLLLMPDKCVDSIRSVTINGHMDMQDPVTDLSNMQIFKELESLFIGNNSQLNSLKGLDSLVSIELLYLVNNPQIKSLQGFEGLINAERFTINSMDSLTTASISDFSLQHCSYLSLQDTPLEDISAFSAVDSMVSVYFRNTNIKDMTWASDIEKIGRVEIRENDSLRSFSFAVNSPLIGELKLENNISLSDFSGVQFQDSVGSIEIENCPISTISNISGPEIVTSQIDIRNTNITQLPPWEGVREVRDIFIVGNNLLEEIEFLKGFSNINSFYISENELLTHIGTLPIDVTHMKLLSISRNPALSDVSVLDYNFNIDRVYIKDNPSLASCDALSICKQYKSVYPQITIDGNGDNCNLIDLNFECDYGNNAYGNVIVKSQEDIDSVQQLFPLMDSVMGNLVIDFSLESNGADYSFFDNIQFVRDRLEIRNPKKDGVFELFEGAEVGGLLLAVLETSSLDIIDYKDELSIFRLYEVDGLEDFTGLENVKEIRDVDIVYCDMKSVDGLDSLKEAYYFQIVDCPELEDISAFNSLELVREFRLALIPKVTGLNVFDSLKVYFDLQLNAIPLMTEIPAFDVGKSLRILYFLRNNGITEVKFDSLERVSQYFFITENPNVKNVSFSSLKDASTFSVSRNENLEQMLFPALHEVTSSLSIRYNKTIESILGINPEAIATTLYINDNESLQLCNSELICNNIELGSTVFVENNPGCLSIDVVTPSCTVAVEDVLEFPVKIYPNPTSGIFEISGEVDINSIQLFNSYGQLMEISKQDLTFMIADCIPGVYFLKYRSKGHWDVQKLIKI